MQAQAARPASAAAGASRPVLREPQGLTEQWGLPSLASTFGGAPAGEARDMASEMWLVARGHERGLCTTFATVHATVVHVVCPDTAMHTFYGMSHSMLVQCTRASAG
jgi:hypothetical protein